MVRGLSRSGGTLLVTVLDSHPELAMSYELYPDLLDLPDGSPQGLHSVVEAMANAGDTRWADVVDHPRFVTFVNRLPRGGMARPDVIETFRAHIADGRGVETVEDRVVLMGRFAAWKSAKERKPTWGVKCLATYDDYLSVYPGTRFLNVVRDGRDVLASTLLEMGRPRSVEQVATGWSSTHLRFRQLQERADVRAHEVVYEELVREPETTIRSMCEAIGLAFDPSMLQHEQDDHSVYSASHLSMDRIRQPIDDSSIGRWRRDLSSDQVEEFMSIAGDTMQLMGYAR